MSGEEIRRPRIVMLVDNGVHGDSRVQKQARSAADAGWDVTLLGRSPNGKKHTWRLGDAEVRLLPAATPGLVPAHQLRGAWPRRPLAYSSQRHADQRVQRIKASRADLRARRAALSLRAGRPRVRTLLRAAPLTAARATVELRRRWVRLRARETESLFRARSSLDAPLDRLTTAMWRILLGDRSWRRLDPQLWDYELGYGGAIDRLRPDIIHANDFRMLGVGARAKLRAHGTGRDVKLVWDAHEFLPGIRPWRDGPRWHPAQCAHEREYARHADAVVTVSDTLAGILAERHGLAERPTVVLNAPDVTTRDRTSEDSPGLRALCGIGPDVPLAVYSGAAAPQRGLDVMVRALPGLPAVHVAFVVNKPRGDYIRDLSGLADELGVGDRVHVVRYVPYDQVVPFLAEADAGVIPIHHWPNHEIALITKFFEYAHARLPLVVSDVDTMARMTRATGQGEVFTADDDASFGGALAAVLERPERYRAAYDAPGLLGGWTWQEQATVLDGVYRRLHPGSTP